MAAPLNLLMVIPSLPVGGAEWAFVRLANALAAQQHRVTVYVPYRCESSPTLFAALKGVVKISLPLPHPFFHRVLYKASLLLQRLRPAYNLEQAMHNWVLRSLYRWKKFDLINPHLRSGTVMVCEAFKDSPVPIIEHDHGDYALVAKRNPAEAALPLLMQRVDAMVCPSKYNAKLISGLPWRLDFQRSVVNYSMPASLDVAPRTDPTFTFGMVSRGVPEKGWAEALEAFRIALQHSDRPMRLVLVGGGPHLDELKALVGENEPVVFTGHQASPADWISGFDVGLLPSCFAAESLPCVVIEYLTLGKPVIATAIGGIPEMLDTENGPCGTLVPISSATRRADVAALAHAMLQLAHDDALRQSMSACASRASLRYDAAVSATACADFFQRVVDRLRFTSAPFSAFSKGPKLGTAVKVPPARHP